jgi:hypothetical protein
MSLKAWGSTILAVFIAFSPIVASADGPQIHVEIHLPAVVKTSGNPIGIDVPIGALTFNGRTAINTGGQQAIRANDISYFWHLEEERPTNLHKIACLGYLFSNNRQAYPIVKSNDAAKAVAPVVGANLADSVPGDSLRPPDTYSDLYPFVTPVIIEEEENPNRTANAAESGGTKAAWLYGTSPGLFTAVGLYTDTTISNVVKVGDAVPARPEPTPPGATPTITALSNVAIAQDYVAFAASGSGFTGAYAKKISDGVVRAVAENFGSNQYGPISYVGMHGARDVIFSANGFYKGDAEGATAPTLITSAIGGTITDIDGDFAGVMGFQAGYKVWKLNLLNGNFQTIVQQGDARPGGGVFTVVQRPGISPDMVVFEGFDENFAYIGIFVWVNGTILPIVRKNDALDGKVVQFPAFEPGAVDGNQMGFVAHFTDGTAGAYLASIGATQLTAAASRKTHGSAGTFDIPLPLTGPSGVECRTGGASGTHTLVFAFSHSVVSGNANVTSGTGSVAGSPAFAGNTMTVQLTGVTNAQNVAVTLSNVTDDIAQVLPSTVVNMKVLLGDTTGNKAVNSTDVSQTKSQSGHPVISNNFREDLTANGSINGSDVSLVKLRVGSGVP